MSQAQEVKKGGCDSGVERRGWFGEPEEGRMARAPGLGNEEQRAGEMLGDSPASGWAA